MLVLKPFSPIPPTPPPGWPFRDDGFFPVIFRDELHVPHTLRYRKPDDTKRPRNPPGLLKNGLTSDVPLSMRGLFSLTCGDRGSTPAAIQLWGAICPLI